MRACIKRTRRWRAPDSASPSARPSWKRRAARLPPPTIPTAAPCSPYVCRNGGGRRIKISLPTEQIMRLLNKHIVVIDDTHSILTFLRISLEALGATFHGAATASGGLALCETANPDLIILDLHLPDKEGLNILPRLKH